MLKMNFLRERQLCLYTSATPIPRRKAVNIGWQLILTQNVVESYVTLFGMHRIFRRRIRTLFGHLLSVFDTKYKDCTVFAVRCLWPSLHIIFGV